MYTVQCTNLSASKFAKILPVYHNMFIMHLFFFGNVVKFIPFNPRSSQPYNEHFFFSLNLNTAYNHDGISGIQVELRFFF
jgi:hypothetical protein